ncbi:probable disease resistance protein RXW24L [Quercus robur]|uniref:probable disease resistance protein RXW24L n=1 Tax=Quercus robur TaxID=38942 RepID=UPI002163C507|nr:probable disease resistance protein RXW24L [Quercus robur]
MGPSLLAIFGMVPVSWTLCTIRRLVNAFPWEERKILLTSRNKDLPSKVDANCLVHELQCLDYEKSWQLFEKILMAQRQDFIISNEMKNLGKEMVKDCGGIPWAIFLLQCNLAPMTSEQWRDQVGHVCIKEDLQVIERLALSYYDLSPCLKQCFLHLGHFPKGFEIPAKELIRMWMAEGFIPEIQHERNTMETEGEKFLEELDRRCMVQIGKRDSFGRIKTCRIHDFMLFFCVSKAQEENFLQIINIPSLKERRENDDKVRRIAINEEQHNSDPPLRLTISKDYPHLRSLLYFCPDNLNSSYLVKSMFKNFKSLRVLNLKNFGFYKGELPKDIGCLIHLRFLSLKNSNIDNVPSSVGNLRCLQTLDLRSCTNGFRVPNVFKKMEKLRHLYLPINYRVSEKLELANLPNLQTLVNVDLNKCNLPPTFPSLRVLVIGTDPCNEETTDIVSMVSSCPHLYRLNLKSKIRQLPEDEEICQHIAKLTLKFTFLQEDPMPILGKLRKLKILRLLLNSFEGNRMTCNKNGFPHLRSLVLSDLTYLSEWVVEEEAMKILCHLEIACQALRMIPDGLRFVTTLQELDISTMPESFKHRYSREGTEFDKVARVRSCKL